MAQNFPATQGPKAAGSKVPPNGGGGKGPEKDLEDLHFRMDDHERDLASIKNTLTPENLLLLVHGIVAGIKAKGPGDGEDDDDEELKAGLEKLCSALERQCECLDRLCEAIETQARR